MTWSNFFKSILKKIYLTWEFAFKLVIENKFLQSFTLFLNKGVHLRRSYCLDLPSNETIT